MDTPGSSPPPRRRSSARLALGVATALAGLVWIGQGTGVLSAGGSFMIGDPTWTVIGAVFVVVGVLVAVRELRRA